MYKIMVVEDDEVISKKLGFVKKSVYLIFYDRF